MEIDATVANGEYLPLKVVDTIVAARGPDSGNDGLARVFDLAGNLTAEFLAVATGYGARVAMGDVDGDGIDEIIVTPGPGRQNKAGMTVFRADGSQMAAALR